MNRPLPAQKQRCCSEKRPSLSRIQVSDNFKLPEGICKPAPNLSRIARCVTVASMKISIIIPVKPGGAVAALDPLRNLEAGSPDHEIIVAEGRRPSCQRNLAAAAAEGDILYFLD